MKNGLLAFCICLSIIDANANDTLTRAQVYNFNVGDTFVYKRAGHNEIGPGDWRWCNVYRAIVRSIRYSQNNDTLYLERQLDYKTAPLFLDTLVVIDLQSHLAIPDSNANCIHLFNVDTNSQYNSRISNIFITQCAGDYYESRFVEGLGLVYTYSNLPSMIEDLDTLMYYSNGTEIWGVSSKNDSLGDCLTVSEVEEIRNPNSEFRISPNPATTSVTISIDESMLGGTVTISDVTGRKILAVPLSTANCQLSTENFDSGVYFVKVTASNGRSATKKLIIQN